MRNHVTILIAAIVVIVLLAYAFTFQVRYDQVAVVQTFGNVTAPATDEAGRIERDAAGNVVDPGSLEFEPGLYFKWPWPIQKVTTYSRKLHLLDTALHQVETKEGQSVVVKSYLTWRVDNPHAVMTSAGNVKAVEERLRDWMSNLSGLIGAEYTFTDLVNNDPEKLKREELEQRFADRLRERLAQNEASYGVTIEQVGIRRVLLPEAVTPNVLDRMAATRQRMAQNARSQGQARAQAITAQAESQRRLILEFARNQAEALRAAGDAHAAQYYDAFSENEDLAVFLRQVETLETILPHNTTYILDAKSMDPLRLLDGGAEKVAEAAKGTDSQAQAESEQGGSPVAEGAAAAAPSPSPADESESR